MFGTLGMPELILIFVIALLLFGPRKMPQIGKSVGRALGEFRRASNEFKRTIDDEVAAEDLRSVRRDLDEVGSFGRDTAEAVRRAAGTGGAARDETPAPGESSSAPGGEPAPAPTEEAGVPTGEPDPTPEEPKGP